MQSLVEYAPTIVVIAGAGLIAGFAVAGFWLYGKRKWPANPIGGPDEPTKWTTRWGKDLAPVKKDQRVSYPATTYASREVEAEIVASDELTRNLAVRR